MLGRRFDLFTGGLSPDESLLQRKLIPPLPVSRGELVWGFHVLETARSLHVDTLPAEYNDVDDKKALELALRLENRRDGYSWEEKARILDCMGAPGAAGNAVEIESLVQSEGSFIPGAERYTALPKHIRILVENGMLDLKSAEAVEGLTPPVAREIVTSARSFTFSERRQIFTWIYEIIERDRRSESEGTELVRRLASEAPVFIAGCRQARFPELNRLETELREFKENYLKGSGVDLQPPPQFEGDRFEIRFRFKDDRQLDKIIRTLNKVRENSDELYRLLYAPH